MSQDNIYDFKHTAFDNTAYFQNSVSLQFASSVPPQRHSPAANTFPQVGYQTNIMIHPQQSMQYPTYGSNRYDKLDMSLNQAARPGQSKAERRAEHNATERMRREHLNAKFQQLAYLLPNLQNDSRPSKSTIIERTLDFVKCALTKEARMQNELKKAEKINGILLSQLDDRNKSSHSVAKKESMDHPANASSPGSLISEETYMDDPHMPDNNQTQATDILVSEQSPTFSVNNSFSMGDTSPVSHLSVNMLPREAYPSENNIHHWSNSNNNNQNELIMNSKHSPTHASSIKDEMLYYPFNNQATFHPNPRLHDNYAKEEFPTLSPSMNYNLSQTPHQMTMGSPYIMTSGPIPIMNNLNHPNPSILRRN
ncbi:hypothetical protein BDB01DRAFT_846309 [Pilobolus umbonatus]|nr:hypothetical protein BDB01DRAFT_846309 [Pilobolus umbonatus]